VNVRVGLKLRVLYVPAVRASGVAPAAAVGDADVPAGGGSDWPAQAESETTKASRAMDRDASDTRGDLHGRGRERPETR
jgi:hypothetical protein